ncbi:MAG: hypothetical protein PHH77_10910 [Victivallaceae bacterium]|nr:hypothetical protein [Victivallaceae bacterium]
MSEAVRRYPACAFFPVEKLDAIVEAVLSGRKSVPDCLIEAEINQILNKMVRGQQIQFCKK